MSKADSSIEFVSLLTEHQADLWAFIVSLMPGHPDTKDVLQKTNVLLWKKQQPPFPRPPVQPNGCFRGLPQKQIPSSHGLRRAAAATFPA